MDSTSVQSLSKQETLAMAQKEYQKKHIERHVQENERVYYMGERKQRTFKLMGALYIFVFVVFGLFSAALETYATITPMQEPDEFDYEALAVVFLVVSLASLFTFVLLLGVYPITRVLLITQTRIILIEKPNIGGGRVRTYNLKDTEEVGVEFDVRSTDFPSLSFSESERDEIVQECRSRPDTHGVLTVRSAQHILKPYFRVNVENCNALIDSLSSVLDRRPDLTSSSQRNSLSFGFGISLAVFIPFFVVVFLITFLKDPHLLLLLTPFFLICAAYVVFGIYTVYKAWNALTLSFSFSVLTL